MCKDVAKFVGSCEICQLYFNIWYQDGLHLTLDYHCLQKTLGCWEGKNQECLLVEATTSILSPNHLSCHWTNLRQVFFH